MEIVQLQWTKFMCKKSICQDFIRMDEDALLLAADAEKF